MRAELKAIEIYLPERVLTNDALAAVYSGWSASKIESKTGIVQRHIAAPDETAGDMAIKAARRLFESGRCEPSDVDFILLCTQSPDYVLPTTACIVQAQLGLPTSVGALDFNLGCSGFVYGLALANAMIESGQAVNVLLLTSDTYSKFIHDDDRSVRTLFGDGAAATIVSGRSNGSSLSSGSEGSIGPFIFGTDGRGAMNLVVRSGGARQARTPETAEVVADADGNRRSLDNLYMNGGEIFSFALQNVPRVVAELLARAKLDLGDVDFFVFHQANAYMMEYLRRRINIPDEKFVVRLCDVGNTVSSTIPIALHQVVANGRIRSGDLLMLVGFGVGYSWSATLVRWS